MKKWTLIDKASTPDGDIIALYEHDRDYVIRINGQELMSTRKHASEEALASLACQPFSRKKKIRALIGGLGLGFTLRAALNALGKDAHVVVAEIIPAVVLWNRNPTYPLAASALVDERVEVIEKDVVEVIRSNPSGFDVIMLDVDNGPFGISVNSNKNLYREKGLLLAKEALRPGGCLGIWSAQADPLFAKFMSQVGFIVDVQQAPAYKSSGQLHTIFLGRVS